MVGRVGEGAQRVADHRRLLVDLLVHEVAVVALADQRAGERGLLDLARHRAAVGVVDRRAARAQHRPVALLQVLDAVGQRRQRQRVGADEHLAARHSRSRAGCRGARQISRSSWPANSMRQARTRLRSRLSAAAGRRHRRRARSAGSGSPVAAPTSVSVSVANWWPRPVSSSRSAWKFSMMPLWTTATPPASCGWALSCGRRAVGRPARVADPGGRRRAARSTSACSRLPSLPSARRRSIRPSHQRRDAGAVVAAVLQPLERIEQQRRGRLPADDADDSTHRPFLPSGISGPRRRARIRARAARDVRLPAARDAEAAGRHVAVDRAAGADERAVADRHRRDQRRIRADERAGADLGMVLGEAVVVAGDRAGADVGAWRRRARRRCRSGDWPWRRRSSVAFLTSTKLPIVRARADRRARPQPGERPDPRARPRSATPSRWQNGRICARTARPRTPGPNTHVGADLGAGSEHGVGGEEHGLRPDQRHAAGHRRAAQPLLQQRLGGGELRPAS